MFQSPYYHLQKEEKYFILSERRKTVLRSEDDNMVVETSVKVKIRRLVFEKMVFVLVIKIFKNVLCAFSSVVIWILYMGFQILIF